MTATPTDSTVAPDELEAPAAQAPGPAAPDRLVEEDLLVEDVSIDGMCGVY